MVALMVTHFIADNSKLNSKSIAITIGPEKKSDKSEVNKNTEKNKSDTENEDSNGPDNYTDVLLFFCVSVAIFKFSRSEFIQLYSIGFGITFTSFFIFRGSIVSENIPNLIFVGLFVVITLASESKSRKNFFKQYDYFRHRHYDSIRIKQELNYARDMQLAMLPENYAMIDNIEIAAVSVPATEVGGDYFDYFRISEDKIGVFICDVSGHGVVSALLLSGLRSCMHLILEDTSNPREVFVKLNKMIRKTQSRKMFVTAIFAVIDTKEETCSLFNAGHLPPYKISGDSNELFKIRKHGITLGATDKLEETEGESEVIFEFKKNDKLVFYTDGLSEAMNPKKEEFGFERLENFLNQNADKDIKSFLDALHKYIEEFTQGTVQKDDLTILIIGKK